MTTAPPPSLKSRPSTPTGPSLAEAAPTHHGAGAPKVVAEGVPTSVPPAPRHAAPLRVVGELTIRAPYRATPTARSWCACGRDLTATGQADVLALVEDHAAHRDACPHHTGQTNVTLLRPPAARNTRRTAA
ncbi:hypothetical protein OG349_20435 [Streptomyces sp. NBC_01317]|uniref:hypothetical protein n=1 Tax=Streptomyces sp. NBC_01317 TaxID=2903822 RepID=UPI002E117A4C|nr:hypothetical protein OG349_20435 [Streptomyces sp. NBC_01317]